jgi:hypothetical protein
MKIRSTFVTNSSSSSFVCIGITEDNFPEITDEIKIKIFDNLVKDGDVIVEDGLAYNSYWYNNGKKYPRELNTEEDKIEYVCAEQDENGTELLEVVTGLECYGPDWGKALGLNISSVFNQDKEFYNMTPKQMKEWVANRLNETLGTNYTADDMEYYQEGWFNG